MRNRYLPCTQCRDRARIKDLNLHDSSSDVKPAPFFANPDASKQDLPALELNEILVEIDCKTMDSQLA